MNRSARSGDTTFAVRAGLSAYLLPALQPSHPGEQHVVLANLTLGLIASHVPDVLFASFEHKEHLITSMFTGNKWKWAHGPSSINSTQDNQADRFVTGDTVQNSNVDHPNKPRLSCVLFGIPIAHASATLQGTDLSSASCSDLSCARVSA